MARVLLSYVLKDTEFADRIAALLAHAGHTVLARVYHRNDLAHEYTQRDFTIVIWSRASIKSRSVCEDAQDAFFSESLIQVFCSDVEPDDLPSPFNSYPKWRFGDINDAVVALNRRALFLLGHREDGDVYSLGPSERELTQQHVSIPTGMSKGGQVPEIEEGWLVHKIPRDMRVSVTETIEVRLGHTESDVLASNLRGRGPRVVEALPIVETSRRFPS